MRKRASLVANLGRGEERLPCLILDSSQGGFRVRGSFRLRRRQVVEVILDEDPLNAVRFSVIWVSKPGSKQEGEAGLQRVQKLLHSGPKRFRTKGWLPVAVEFLKAFPMLEDVLIESWQEGIGMGNPYTSTLPSRAYGRSHPITSRVIACANRNCKSGAFDILQDISKMVNERLTTKEFVQACAGNEDFKGLGRCTNTLHYRLTLEYGPRQTPD